MLAPSSRRLQYRLFNVNDDSSESQKDIEETFAIDQDPLGDSQVDLYRVDV
jgi:hypothetical protein